MKIEEMKNIEFKSVELTREDLIVASRMCAYLRVEAIGSSLIESKNFDAAQTGIIFEQATKTVELLTAAEVSIAGSLVAALTANKQSVKTLFTPMQCQALIAALTFVPFNGAETYLSEIKMVSLETIQSDIKMAPSILAKLNNAKTTSSKEIFEKMKKNVQENPKTKNMVN